MSDLPEEEPDFGGAPAKFGKRTLNRIEAVMAAFVPASTRAEKPNVHATFRSGEPNPKPRITDHHQKLFQSGAGIGWPKYRALSQTIARTIEEGVAFATTQDRRLKGMAPEIVLNEAATPWTVISWVKVICCGLMVAAAMVMSATQITTSLVTAGLVETKFEASGWLIIPLIGPFAVKSLAEWMSESGRKRHICFLGTATILLLISWCVLFSATFGDALSPEIPRIPEPGEETSSGPAWILLAVGLLGECCFGAVLFLAIDQIAEKHQQRAPNKVRQRLERVVRDVRLSLAWLEDTARPRCAEIVGWHEAEQARLVQEALDLFDDLRSTAAVLDLQHQRDAGPFRSAERGFNGRSNNNHPNSNGANL